MSANSVSVRVVNRSAHPLPQYATSGSSGVDLRADIQEPVLLAAMERAMIPTGIFVELTDGYELQVRPRSGLAIKQGLTCLNSPGTIDADYRGEIKVILINLSTEPQAIQPGDRIAQMVLQKVEKIEWITADALPGTERGTGGFGHTGR